MKLSSNSLVDAIDAALPVKTLVFRVFSLVSHLLFVTHCVVNVLCTLFKDTNKDIRILATRLKVYSPTTRDCDLANSYLLNSGLSSSSGLSSILSHFLGFDFFEKKRELIAFHTFLHGENFHRALFTTVHFPIVIHSEPW